LELHDHHGSGKGELHNPNQYTDLLTLSSPMIPFGIMLLSLFFIRYNSGELERVNPFQPPQNCSI
jgi:hypothetical protein